MFGHGSHFSNCLKPNTILPAFLRRPGTLVANLFIFAMTVCFVENVNAAPKSFPSGSLVIPMDTTYQNNGTLKAFGLVYKLLQADIPVYWLIEPTKNFGGADFVTSAVDTASGAVINQHGYRGGPFAIDEKNSEQAMPIIAAWKQSHITAVHKTTTSFTAHVRRTLTAAPTIAIFADGNEIIAFEYLNAAAIPDSTGKSWPTKKAATYPLYPDVLSPALVAGPSATNHQDGALFDTSGNPKFCQIASMHWGVNDATNAVVGEYRSFLQHPTHLVAECQAVNAIENNPLGRFLTTNGIAIASAPKNVSVLNPSLAFVQFDGAWGIVGGSEPAFKLPVGSQYYDTNVVMITDAATGVGKGDVWMTGYIDGACPILLSGDEAACEKGKVSYLGGHAYDTAVPISSNPDTNGARVFLNSMFEAECVASFGQPTITFTMDSPATTLSPVWTNTIVVENAGPGTMSAATLTVTIPPGTTLTTVPNGATFDPITGTLTWVLGVLPAGTALEWVIEMEAADYGVYFSEATLQYVVGATPKTIVLTSDATQYDDFDDDNDGLLNDVEVFLGTDPTDPDSDGDGLLDVVETNGGQSVDTDGDGFIDALDMDSDADGVDDATDGAEDFDNDGVPNYRDPDDDNDGLPTFEEWEDGGMWGHDPDGDGIPNWRDVDSDGDSALDSDEDSDDVDGDGIPDYLDANDNDGPLGDLDGDGLNNGTEETLGTDSSSGDSDGDGIGDWAETDGGLVVDTDGDSIVDALDTDSDSDGWADMDEGSEDTDGDGIGNWRDADDDGDGILTAEEIADSANSGFDVDGDTWPNWLDTDSDGDSLTDGAEGTGDSDGDGARNYLDADSDDDGAVDGEDCAPINGAISPNAAEICGDGTDNDCDGSTDEDCFCPNGDVTVDGIVNVVDVQCMTLVSLSYLTESPLPICLGGPASVADLNCDNAVNISDVLIDIGFTLKNPLSLELDANQDSCVDACQ